MNPAIEPEVIPVKKYSKLKIAGILLTLAGIALFVFLLLNVGIDEIHAGIVRFGIGGFAIILGIYFLRLCLRSIAWQLSVYDEHHLRLRDSVPAVIIGEALSNMIPLGIVISGTAKALAVRKRIPMVVGMSSIAVENIFFCYVTAVFLIFGSTTILVNFPLERGWVIAIGIFMAIIVGLMLFGFAGIIRQWHIGSETLEWFHKKGIAQRKIEAMRPPVRLFENLLYGFYRKYPKRFLPLCLCEAVFHLLGATEVWFILSRLNGEFPPFLNAVLLETVSRVVLMLFKLVPFVVGVDEAGAQMVGETLGFAAGVGVTLALIRKGRVLFWTGIGLILIAKRGLTFKEIREVGFYKAP